jgi:zinc D-Ala-D-Ala dipeptidase
LKTYTCLVQVCLLLNLFLPGTLLCATPARTDSVYNEQKLLDAGLVDIQSIDSTIRVELKYSDTLNFMKTDVYGDLDKCFLRKEAAIKLAKAGELLRRIRPDLRLLVVDGFRPRHVQRRMWSIVKGTAMRNYVANPRYGSMHNYGCAVDITLCDTNGIRLDMGTPVDHFGALAEPRLEQKFLREKKLSRHCLDNRKLLRTVMIDAGFHPLPIEWWHFDAFGKEHVRRTYEMIE